MYAGWEPSDRAAPVSLDPCIGAGAGSRLHFRGTSELEPRGGRRGELERIAYEMVATAVGRSEQADGGRVPLDVLQGEASRIVWTSGE